MKRQLQLAAAAFTLGLFGSDPGAAFDGVLDSALYESSPAAIARENARTLLTTFSNHYDSAFQKTLDRKHAFFSIYYRDLYTNAASPYLMSEQERNAEARLVVRQALYSAVQDTVNDLNLLYTLKEYGQALTSANLKVSDGDMNFEGPSLNRAGNSDDPSLKETLRSSLMLISNADFGLCFRTRFGSVQSNLIYFLAGPDRVGASLEKEFIRETRLVLDYRVATDENRAVVSLKFPFRF